MGTLKGFPNPPALWLRGAKPRSANAIMMGTLKGFPNPPALWLRGAKPRSANAIMTEILGRRIYHCSIPSFHATISSGAVS